MKARTGFVSNSSSSSFVVPRNDNTNKVTFSEFKDFLRSLFNCEEKTFNNNVAIIDKNECKTNEEFLEVAKREINRIDGTSLEEIDFFDLSKFNSEFNNVFDKDWELDDMLSSYNIDKDKKEKIKKKFNEFIEFTTECCKFSLLDAWSSPSVRFVVYLSDNFIITLKDEYKKYWDDEHDTYSDWDPFGALTDRVNEKYYLFGEFKCYGCGHLG